MKKQLTSEELKLKLSAILDDEVERVIFFGQIDNPSDRSEQLSDGFRNVSITLKKDFVMQDLKTLEVFFYGCHAVISQERMYAEHMSSDPRDFILGELGIRRWGNLARACLGSTHQGADGVRNSVSSPANDRRGAVGAGPPDACPSPIHRRFEVTVQSDEDRKKRLHDEGTDQRTPYERDRDRVLYCSAFRRLNGVTQVVSADQGPLFHNRLTHRAGQPKTPDRRMVTSFITPPWNCVLGKHFKHDSV